MHALNRLLLSALIVVCGCVKAARLEPAEIKQFAPLAELGGVRLGMSGVDLRQLRTQARPLPYTGLTETGPDGYEVFFYISNSIDTTMRASDRLTSVAAVRHFSGRAEAESEWARQLGNLRRAEAGKELPIDSSMDALGTSSRKVRFVATGRTISVVMSRSRPDTSATSIAVRFRRSDDKP